MLGLGSSFMTSRLSNLLLALTLVVSWLAATVQADSSLGTDAPGPSADSGGDSTAYNAAGASGSNGGLSKTAQIAIGVVVGVIGIAAIAGAIIFFFRRKKKWDEKIKRYETIHAYHTAKKEAGRKQAMSLRQQRRQQRQRQHDSEQGMLEISEIERDTTRDSGLPKYDPSSFHGHHYSIDSSRGLSIDIPRESLMSNNHRHSSSLSNSISSMPPPPSRPRGASERRAERAMDRDVLSAPEESKQPSSKLSTVASQSASDDEPKPKGPKKPKPALTRLITNL